MTESIPLSRFDQAAHKGGFILGFQDKNHTAIQGTGVGLKGRIIRWRIHTRQKQGFRNGIESSIRMHYIRKTRNHLFESLRSEYGKDIAAEMDLRFRIRLAPKELTAQTVREVLDNAADRRKENNIGVLRKYLEEKEWPEIRRNLAEQVLLEQTENHRLSIDRNKLAEVTEHSFQNLEQAVHNMLDQYQARLTDPERHFLGDCLLHPSIGRLPSCEREKAVGIITERYLVQGLWNGASYDPAAICRTFGVDPASDTVDGQNLVPVLYHELDRLQKSIIGMRLEAEKKMTAFERLLFGRITGPEWTGGLRRDWEYQVYIRRTAAQIRQISECFVDNDFSIKPGDVWRILTGMDPPGEVDQHNFARLLIDDGKQREYRGVEEYRLSIAANLSGRSRLLFLKLTNNRLIRDLKTSWERKEWIDLVQAHIADLANLPDKFDRKDVWQAIRKNPMPENVTDVDFFIRLMRDGRPVDAKEESEQAGPHPSQSPGPDPLQDVPEVRKILNFMNQMMDQVMFLTEDSRQSGMEMLHTILERIDKTPEKIMRVESYYTLGTMVIQSRGHDIPKEETGVFDRENELCFSYYLYYWGLLGEFAKRKGYQLFFRFRICGSNWLMREEVDFESVKPNDIHADISHHIQGIWRSILHFRDTEKYTIEVILRPLIEDPKIAQWNRHVRYKNM